MRVRNENKKKRELSPFPVLTNANTIPTAPRRRISQDVIVFYDANTVKQRIYTIRYALLVAASSYAEMNVVTHADGTRSLDIPCTAVNLAEVREILRYIRTINPPFTAGYDKNHSMTVLTGQSLEYYVQIYRTSLFLELKSPMTNQPRVRYLIRQHFKEADTIQKEDVALVWGNIGTNTTSKAVELMRDIIHLLVESLGLDTDHQSKGSAEVVPGLTVWEDHQASYPAELNAVVNNIYKSKMHKMQNAVDIRDREILKAKEQASRALLQKAKKRYNASSGVNLRGPDEFEALKALKKLTI
ncbi:hypothetical protein EJ08DRAFT_664599 [Tothia fuscella]|uniref:Uncharacterized protein n=1 Tax=Tothia fuscella TaxID=1048955 RepID=A0A9P4NIF5_9PEZI|nr:hypothetical protein EJ08DRAFT_664599 [Tothia fuscella]